MSKSLKNLTAIATAALLITTIPSLEADVVSNADAKKKTNTAADIKSEYGGTGREANAETDRSAMQSQRKR